MDFDDEDWLGDAAAFLDTCRRLEVPAVLERSRSGNGGHGWFFFEEANPATLARGVDVSLANLFVHVARSPHANTEGEARARSASEAFLFRRLQSLPATSGRFRLNVELPIPFDDHGKMEVDFLCGESGVVIEFSQLFMSSPKERQWQAV